MKYTVEFDTDDSEAVAYLLNVIDQIKNGDTLQVAIVETKKDGSVRSKCLSVD